MIELRETLKLEWIKPAEPDKNKKAERPAQLHVVNAGWPLRPLRLRMDVSLPGVRRYTDGTVKIVAHNGEAEYRLGRYDASRDLYDAVRIA